MQKFNGGEKVNKVKGYKFPGKVVAVFKPSNGEWRYVVEMDHYGLLHIFNGEQIEGELLEGGGTVGKSDGHETSVHSKDCCVYPNGLTVCGCLCHNKKEERPLCNWKSCQLTTEKKGIGSHNYRTLCNGHRGKRFNRETPKECCCRGRIKAPASHSLNRCAAISKKEVKLPEKILFKGFKWGDADYHHTDFAEMIEKINQILTYLASKES